MGLRLAMLAGGAVAGMMTAGLALATEPATSGSAKDGSPAWRLQPGFPDPVGRATVDDAGRVTVLPRGPGLASPTAGDVPNCAKSIVCTRKGGPNRQATQRVVWAQTMGYTVTYPFHMPPVTSGTPGGTPGVAIDPKGDVWVLQRKPKGQPQLYKFDAKANLILTVPADVIGYQEKAHDMKVDAAGDAWIVDVNGATVEEISPDGKLLKTIGVKDKRGDWDEAKGQRLLWQPTAIAFGNNGDIYIGEGHANESPNDVESGDPANVVGAARVLHLDKDGKFIGQWFGDDVGQGKFDQVHGMAADPKTGDVWLADREQYRIVIYSPDGKFLRTLQMRNLICSIGFDPKGQVWVTSGQDGQLLKIDRNGKVLGAFGGGMGIEPGQFIEAAYFDFDKAGNIYVGDTSISRIAKISPPKAKGAAAAKTKS